MTDGKPRFRRPSGIALVVIGSVVAAGIVVAAVATQRRRSRPQQAAGAPGAGMAKGPRKLGPPGPLDGCWDLSTGDGEKIRFEIENSGGGDMRVMMTGPRGGRRGVQGSSDGKGRFDIRRGRRAFSGTLAEGSKLNGQALRSGVAQPFSGARCQGEFIPSDTRRDGGRGDGRAPRSSREAGAH